VAALTSGREIGNYIVLLPVHGRHGHAWRQLAACRTMRLRRRWPALWAAP
jgi:hypothetical protein